MKSYLLPTILLTLIIIAACDRNEISEIQTDSFIKYFNNYPEFSAADTKEITGSGYAILGTVSTSDFATQLCLLRTDEYGNTIDSARLYGRALEDRAYCLQVLEDGGLAILGSSVNQNTGHLEVYFIRTNSVGDILWSRTIAESGDVEAKHFEVNDEGSFYLTGYYKRGTTDKQIWLFALAEDGSNLWPNPKTSGGDKDDEGSHLQLLQNGNLIITGYTRSYPSGSLINHAFIMRTDENGALDIFYQIPSMTDEKGNCVRSLSNDNFLILGTAGPAAASDIFLKYVTLAELKVKWEKTYGTLGADIGRCLLADGNIFYLLGTTSTAGINTAISLITTDGNGNQTALANFGMGSELSGSSFEKTADGGFIISGTNKHSDKSITAALIKTRANTAL